MTSGAVDYAMLNETASPRMRYLLRESLGQLYGRTTHDEFDQTRVTFDMPHGYFTGQATINPWTIDDIIVAPLGGNATAMLLFPGTGVTRASPHGDEAVTASEIVSEVVTTEVLERELARHLGALFKLAQEERFEDGMSSNLSIGLHVLFRNYSTDFAQVLEGRLKKSDISSRILVEVLYTLGRIRDDGTKDWRLAALADHLKASSPSVRDAASVGLAYLDEKKAIPYLREAIERESSEAFREDLRAVLEQLDA